MSNFIYHAKATLLLEHHSPEKVNVLYNQNLYPFQLPKIGPRPPYYTHPRYEPYYPII
ncbi:hypothetical protein M3182_00845 [Mesobacillus maritimus]|uniref:hypothetical protein n=1 Tax=Mesobacillus maritimus TaxID=1643336 RepID=UPI00203C1D07|nr:hypothetical protein [Mesobacillus maritimus]MCM3584287.1 hypothetical protein [Mesobacillus maritimus]MCM3669296.1 hypothetical protein [Mesobacillus maritimus]